MQDRERIVGVGILGFFGFVVWAYHAPGVVAELLMAFSVVAFVFGVVGLLKPAWARLPNRAAAVWAWAVSVGLFVGGGMLSAPQPELVRSEAHDRRVGARLRTEEARRSELARDAARRVAPGPAVPEREATDPCSIINADVRGWPQERIERAWSDCADAARDLGYVAAEPDPMLDTMEGMIVCQDRLQDAARVLYGAGAVYRWTSPRLGDRFSDARRPSQGVRTLIGDAIEFLNEDGSWLRAIYECDFRTETGQVVDVRTRPGRLR